ncbi:MAG: substrate-binding domain-containing protein [Acidimicrobiia bacterium]|jgi:DNA-binding LacI/PurR family transcriptional regulator
MSSDLRLQVDPKASLPIAAQISEQLHWLIVNGNLAEGDQLPSAQELAEELGVNLHTVRSAYQQLESLHLVSLGRGRRARVLPYDRDRQLEVSTTVRSNTIGVIIPEFVQVYATLLGAIESAASELPALIFVANAHDDPDKAQALIDRLIARGVDGIVVAAAVLLDPTTIVPRLAHTPTVFIDAPGAPGISIEFDLEKSQYLATSHLIEHGHTRIGYVTPPHHLGNVKPKLAGHHRALEEAGIDVDPDLIVEMESFQVAEGEAGAARLLEQTDRPTAITAASDSLAVGVYQAARRLGMAIPDDLAVTSNDNSQLSAISDPALTTVSLPFARAGELAVEAIQRVFAVGDTEPSQTTLDVDLVIRQSCGCEH